MIRRLFRTFLLLLDGAVVVFFLIGYIARYLDPRYAWGAELIAIGLPYLSLLLVGATVLVVAARRWLLAGGHLLLVLLALIRFLSWEGGATPQPDDLTVLTFNTSRGGDASIEELSTALTTLMRTEAPDLVGLQEVYVEYHTRGKPVRPEKRLAALIDSLGYRTIRSRSAQRTTYTSQPVLGRVELIEQTRMNLEEGAPPRRSSHVLRTHFRWKGHEAVHYNLHLRSFGNDKPWEDQQRDMFSLGFWRTYLRQYREAYRVRAREIDKISTLLQQEDLPLIVSGDFNSTPHNSAFYRLARGLQDAFQVAGRGWGATYHVNLPLARIDHVLVSPEWKVVRAHVSPATRSDHLPVVVRLRWRE